MFKNKTLTYIILFIIGVSFGGSMVLGVWLSNEIGMMEEDIIQEKKETPKEDISPVEETDVKELKVGDVAPDFTLPNFMVEEDISLSDYAGKKVILNFFVSWCPYCQQEAPDLEKIHKEFGSEVEVLTINLTASEEKPEDIDKYIYDHGVTTPVLLDFDSEVLTKYNIESTPTNYFINEDGTISHIATGAISYKDMKEILNNME